MIKSAREIEQDVLRIVKASALGEAVKGKVYLLDNVPTGAAPEYITIAHLTGTTDLMQKGMVMVNIFIDGIPYSGRIVADGQRIKALCNLVQEMIWNYDGDYTISTDTNPETIQDAETGVYYINVRLAYSRMCV